MTKVLVNGKGWRCAAIEEMTHNLRARLELTLLTLGGTRVVWSGSDPYLAELIECGQVFEQPLRLSPGRPDACHRNAAKLWAKNRNNAQLGTGYALSEEGIWRQHSWVLRKGHIYETTEVHTRYFGVVKDVLEAFDFYVTHYLSTGGRTPDEDFQAMLKQKFFFELCAALPELLITPDPRTRCPACNTAVGECHYLGCELEPCPHCGEQLLNCDHFDLGNIGPPSWFERKVWTGAWTGVPE